MNIKSSFGSFFHCTCCTQLYNQRIGIIRGDVMWRKLSLVLLSFIAGSNATAASDELFLYSLPQTDDIPALEDPLGPNSKLSMDAEHTSELDLDYSEPCGVKCGLSNTGLFLLQMVVESKADQEYRYQLMNPNYEP